MKVLAILGGPHTHGTTAAMLDCAIEEAKKKGYEVEKIHLYEQQIEFCRGCECCAATQSCVLQDDMVEITQKMRECDRVILAAPTYWANVPAAVKNFFDRLFGAAMEETRTFPKPRFSAHQKYLLLTACHTPFPFSRIFKQSSNAVHAMDEFFKTAGMKRMGAVIADGAKKGSKLPEKIQTKIQRCWK